jgi:prolyl oligopeptidase
MGVAAEIGSPDDPADVRRFGALSPYQAVQDGVPYPALFVDAGDTDHRCPPWHARKLAARIQEATSSDAPMLLRVLEQTGHGWATAGDVAKQQEAEVLAFLLMQLGMTPPERPRLP